MVDLIIRKRVGLEFLGEEYKDSYIEFQALPISKYEDYQKEIEKPDAKNLSIMLDVLKDLFLEGKFKNETITKDDLDQLDIETAITCFNEVTGNSPKVSGPSESSSIQSEQTE